MKMFNLNYNSIDFIDISVSATTLLDCIQKFSFPFGKKTQEILF